MEIRSTDFGNIKIKSEGTDLASVSICDEVRISISSASNDMPDIRVTPSVGSFRITSGIEDLPEIRVGQAVAINLGVLKITQPDSDMPPVRVFANVALNGVGVPPGGGQGQVLRKLSDDTYDTVWANETASQWGYITGGLNAQTDLVEALAGKQSISGMSAYLTTMQASAWYYPANNPSGYLISQDLLGYLTTAVAHDLFYPASSNPLGYLTASTIDSLGYLTASSASTLFYPASSNPAGYLTASSLTGLLTESHAQATYQPLSGMGNYLTAGQADAAYYPINNPEGFINASVLDDFLTTSEASVVYQTQANMVPYMTEAEASVRLLPYYLPRQGGTLASGSVIDFVQTAGKASEIGAWGFGMQNSTMAQTAYLTPESLIIQTNGAGTKVNSMGLTFSNGSTQASAFIPGDYLKATQVNATFAPLISPVLSGDPRAPTPATSDNDTSIATTAYVKNQSYLTTGTAQATYQPISGMGVYSLLDSPVFTGDPRAPTPATSDSDTSIATTAYVKNQSYLTTGSAQATYLSLGSAASTYQTQSGMSAYLTASQVASGYYPLTGNPASYLIPSSLNGYATEIFVTSQGYITASALIPYITTSTAIGSFYPLASNPSGYLVSSDLAPYLLTATASATYQTRSGMSAYLTASQVASGYYPLSSNPAGYLVSSDLTPYLLASTASSTYQTLSGMASYATQSYVTSALSPYITSATASASFYPLSSNPSGYLVSSALAPYLLSATASATYQTLSGMASYAELSGATFTGKVNLNTGTTAVSLNINSNVIPTSSVAGDIWIAQTQLFYRDSTGTLRNTVSTNTGNTFTQQQAISQSSSATPSLSVTQTGNGGGLLVTNTGTGDSFKVEDSTSPDSSSFIIDNDGNVSIGGAVNTASKLYVYGTTRTTDVTFDGTNKFKVSGTQATGVSGTYTSTNYPSEVLLSYGGSTYAVPARLVSTP